MGLAERDYARPRRTGGTRTITFNTWLIIANVAVFVVQGMLPRNIHTVWGPADPIYAFGHFSTVQGFMRLEVWRLVSFQFIHANLIHLVFNMFGLWMFGSLVEDRLGFKRYAAYYIVCGVFGGVAYLALNFLGSVVGLNLPGLIVNDPQTPLVGASAGVFGVIMACAKLAPNERVQLLLPPVPVRLRTFAYGYVAIAALNLFFGGHNAGGDAAHLGGAIAGFFFIRNLHLLRDFFDITGDSRPPRSSRAEARFEAQVDRILEKVRRETLASLSPRERAILKKASERGRGV